MTNYKPLTEAARILKRHPRTIENWFAAGYIHPYSDGSKAIYVDLDEVERELKINPKMRDGRQRFGGATIIPMPVSPSPSGSSE